MTKDVDSRTFSLGNWICSVSRRSSIALSRLSEMSMYIWAWISESSILLTFQPSHFMYCRHWFCWTSFRSNNRNNWNRRVDITGIAPNNWWPFQGRRENCRLWCCWIRSYVRQCCGDYRYCCCKDRIRDLTVDGSRSSIARLIWDRLKEVYKPCPLVGKI